MSWKVVYSRASMNDLKNVYEYIAFELKAPDAALKLYSKLINVTKDLADMPLRNPVYRDDPWKGLGMRWIPVDNFIVFYFSDENSKIVSIARILYKGRDISNCL